MSQNSELLHLVYFEAFLYEMVFARKEIKVAFKQTGSSLIYLQSSISKLFQAFLLSDFSKNEEIDCKIFTNNFKLQKLHLFEIEQIVLQICQYV